MEGLFALLKRRKRLFYIYLATLFLSFHYFTTIYVNSSLLSSYANPKLLSFLYSLGSLLNIIVFIFSTYFLRAFGAYRLFVCFTLLELGAVLGLAFLDVPLLILLVFVFHQALPPLVLFVIDIYLEDAPHSESKTGRLRGVFLTVMNTALVISPLIISAAVKDSNFSLIYITSALFLVPILFIAFFYLKRLPEPAYRPLHIKRTLMKFIRDEDLRNVLISNFLLQLFYAWMVVYTPLYLREVGLSWQDIGLIFTFMLLPFVLFELPIGRLADKFYGEKEFMVAGFITLCLSTALVSLSAGPFAIIWAILLFITRTGASFVEITTESYFFKKVESNDVNLISVFRITRPLSFIIGPIIGAAILLVFDLRYTFIIFATLLASGIFFSLSLKDTR